MTDLFISVIIPTYNRCNSLFRTLKSLDKQTIPKENFEVMVIDDGSTDKTEQVCLNQFNFDLKYKYQSNQGDAAARNTGAHLARGNFLVFLDDDIRIEPGYLEGLYSCYSTEPSTIVMGKTVNKSETTTNTFQSIMSQTIDERMKSETPGFDQLCSNNMGLKKEDYYRIGGMQSLGFEGSDMWCDVDFAYRAYKNNFQFRRNLEAICFHVDMNLESRTKFMRRSEEISIRAVVLFGKYPQLQSHLSMFADMTPISIDEDSIHLIIRKTFRRISASRLILWLLESLATISEETLPIPGILKPLYRWINGAYIYRGFKKGLEYSG